MRLSDAPWRSESATSFDGPLSSRAEWHAFLLGIAAGLRGRVAARSREAADVQSEPWYFATGYVLGWVLRQRYGR